jgi:hypothetical protein
MFAVLSSFPGVQNPGSEGDRRSWPILGGRFLKKVLYQSATERDLREKARHSHVPSTGGCRRSLGSKVRSAPPFTGVHHRQFQESALTTGGPSIRGAVQLTAIVVALATWERAGAIRFDWTDAEVECAKTVGVARSGFRRRTVVRSAREFLLPGEFVEVPHQRRPRLPSGMGPWRLRRCLERCRNQEVVSTRHSVLGNDGTSALTHSPFRANSA